MSGEIRRAVNDLQDPLSTLLLSLRYTSLSMRTRHRFYLSLSYGFHFSVSLWSYSNKPIIPPPDLGNQGNLPHIAPDYSLYSWVQPSSSMWLINCSDVFCPLSGVTCSAIPEPRQESLSCQQDEEKAIKTEIFLAPLPHGSPGSFWPHKHSRCIFLWTRHILL